MNDTRLLSGGPFKTGFIATLGVLLALLLGSAVISLSTAITLIFLALFICLGLYPVVQRLEGRGFSRTGAVLTVLGAFVLVIGLLAWLIVPILVTQAGQLAAYLPKGLDQVEHQDWFVSVNAAFGGALTPALDWLIAATGDPTVWLFVGGGALRVGAGILNGTAGTIFVVVLTLYFVSSLETIKEGVYSLIPKSKRAGFIELSETIAASVGKYLGGMVILAAMNAVFTFILLTACGVPFAPVLAALAFPITLIPLVGPVINTVIVTAVALFSSPSTAVVVLVVMLVYVQIESYVMTPRIVGKAISIPGSLVFIGALVGGTLLGLLGALIACPTSASVLLIMKKVVVPAQNTR
ncbi:MULTISPECIES: AI-2E family transporter [unclassified Cryobacterium]|uniref:AI-2E family transporter n=1 Tax=unclassified Cryobacterium TaxID=2649013 RepID=UPI002AB588A7|nr:MULTISPECIES: AI-2E family transporter [unclassified Cryobacterium]MDY7543851.1 AI-2E family transporter [Cryobacterium sp. 5B3]MEA9998530.1 AI-2E family transporter [Cryobacterium sp. RTS3]MEB0264438.1 AI-2E family transporter [Cryobacterium sp. 10I5]MEB0273563.1 AI-2E family transporter [Cryobacterium sp. 5B3]